ncbi:hypothetical protein Tco_0025279 [Tanacetum coccineum]
MKGTEMTKQKCESMLYDEFHKFTYEPRESIHSYYLRFAKLINDMNMIPMSMTPMQISMKFINHLQPEWSRFVTVAKQARNLHSVTFDQLYAFLKHNERDAKEVREMRKRFPEPLTLLANTYNPHPSYNSNQTQTQDTIQNGQVMVQNVQGRQSQGYAGNAGNNQASGAWVINTIGNAGENQPRVIKCYACNGEIHMAKQCTIKKRVKDSKCFKEKMLLAQVQKAEVVLDEEQHDFLADSFKETDDCCDDEASANTIFMANLSPVGSLNDDTVAPRYDSDTIFKVPHYDTYHDFDVLNYNIQELRYIENIISNNESYDELKGNIDVISYTDYMLTIGNDEDNYVPFHVQNNDMMLSVIEQMKSQVEKCNTVNQEAKSVNGSLTIELEGYKDKVRVLEYAVKDGYSKQEAYPSHELYTLISQRKTQVSELEKQVFSLQTQMKDLNNHIAFLKKKFETLKQESSERYKKIISEIVDLENVKKELENIVIKLDLLTKFDECIKRRTTLSPYEIGSWKQSDIQGAFKADVIPFSENLKETFKLFKKGFITEVKRLKVQYKNDVELEYHVSQLKAAVLSEAQWNSDEGDISKPRSFERHMSKSIKPYPCFYNNDCTYLVDLNTEEKYTTSITKHYATRYYKEVKKFNDGTLVKIQENLIDMLTKNKLGSCNKRLKGRDWTDYDVKSSREMLKKIDEIPRQLRRLEEYVGGRPKTVNPCTFVRPL